MPKSSSFKNSNSPEQRFPQKISGHSKWGASQPSVNTFQVIRFPWWSWIGLTGFRKWMDGWLGFISSSHQTPKSCEKIKISPNHDWTVCLLRVVWFHSSDERRNVIYASLFWCSLSNQQMTSKRQRQSYPDWTADLTNIFPFKLELLHCKEQQSCSVQKN